MTSRQVQTTINFRARKTATPPSSKKKSPVEDKLDKLMLRTPTPAKRTPRRDENSKVSSVKTTPRISRNLFDAKQSRKIDEDDSEVLQVSPTKQRKPSVAEENKCSDRKQRVVSPYERAKLLLNASFVERFVYRDNEFKQIRNYIDKHLRNEEATSLYVSGAPGTGKTLCINHVIKDLREKYSFKLVFVNCMDCRTPNAIYSKIVTEFGLASPKTPKANLELIEEKIVTPSKKKPRFTVVVLDEVDKLESKGQDVLYTLFDLPQRSNSHLVLIGIANTLDFTTRSLSRLKSLKRDDVEEIHFQPYTKDQVKGIIATRLKEVAAECPIFNDTAIELCARKVATHSGDVRKALHVCRRAIELAECEAVAAMSSPKSALKQTSDDGLNPGSPRKRKNVDSLGADTTFKQVTVMQIMKVLSEVYGSQTVSQPGKAILPTQQQVILCALLVHSKNQNKKEIELSKCYQIFSRICKQKSIGYDVGNNSEFLSMCHLLESKSFISVKAQKDKSQAKLSLAVDEQDVEDMMTDKNLFKSILNDNFN